ncbi:tripartite tricarboxylate transporter TctB family protein [Microvirga zambiensis]|uniref:tripartite tricarboxylate transporter TctB family protein n=1 Tax=Microvirga zambiensis TaxID=1402137 RepID=UPI00191CEE2B|nr:tripartite tricarboxylate transporter TctB family protein [Microvirga zambiensis]
MNLLRSPDGQSGLFFTAFGLIVATLALQYPLGTPARMGPGFFPFWLGILLTVTGSLVIVQSLRAESERIAPLEWRSAAIITLAIVISASLLLTAGLLIAIPALVIISAFAGRNVKILPVVITAAVLTAMAYAIFILGLDLRIPLLWGL